MKRVEKCENIEQLPKKNKRNLSICTDIPSLPCEICNNNVFNYKTCVGQHVYCSIDCFEILYLRMLNELQKYKDNDDDLLLFEY